MWGQLMVICSSDKLKAAREAHPDEPIVCEDTLTVHFAGTTVVAHIWPGRLKKAKEDGSTVIFAPE